MVGTIHIFPSSNFRSEKPITTFLNTHDVTTTYLPLHHHKSTHNDFFTLQYLLHRPRPIRRLQRRDPPIPHGAPRVSTQPPNPKIPPPKQAQGSSIHHSHPFQTPRKLNYASRETTIMFVTCQLDTWADRLKDERLRRLSDEALVFYPEYTKTKREAWEDRSMRHPGGKPEGRLG